MNSQIKVLDHGYIKLIEHWGSDERIIESARMSTGKGFLGWGPIHNYDEPTEDKPGFGFHNISSWDCGCKPKQGDEKLLAFLYNNNHLTPFEMCGATIEVQAPIFVFREWHRHRTQSYNELSARYTELPNLFYVPDWERLIKSGQSQVNKQGSKELNEEVAGFAEENLRVTYHFCRQKYEEMLGQGVAREIARLVIPVAQYSRMRASANLRNWMQFLTLRMAENAQYEIRVYAHELHDILKSVFPRTMELFDGGQK